LTRVNGHKLAVLHDANTQANRALRAGFLRRARWVLCARKVALRGSARCGLFACAGCRACAMALVLLCPACCALNPLYSGNVLGAERCLAATKGENRGDFGA
jgi:hypothetical protein